ncbi:unnamed protein product [Bursaphelenchus okinawaensis]|uniref:Fungal lipase-type domain-containing protein n=1 Tax=Bursaphelenchus okinawaensis TaxID=465554 RepID=A0A811KTS0_9BILA|nr:unnamed protein product [Bursaphelenchus okinawaensis]CAG9110387.1 unnamed protein product [Bursaphelenchus okinawaensis]
MRFIVLLAVLCVAGVIGKPFELGWFKDEYIRTKVFPIAAAAYSETPEDCVKNTFPNGTVLEKVRRLCGDGYVEPELCFAFIGVDHTEKVIFMSFRGTRGLIQLAYEARRTVFKNRIQVETGGTVSEYFYSVYRSILDTGISAEFIKLFAQNPHYEVLVTGHSLGGAMASIAAMDLVHMAKVPSEQVKLVTFGQPRTGDQKFAEDHDRLIPHTYRITHGRDIVPHVPPVGFEGYNHHTSEVWYNNNMLPGDDYIVCEEQEDYKCSNSNYLNYSILAHLYYYNLMVSDYGMKGCPAS